MDFVKKNLVSMIIGAIALAALIFAFIGMLDCLGVKGVQGYDALPKASHSGVNSTLYGYIGIMISAIGVLAVVILSILGLSKFNGIILICTGIIATIFIIMSMAVGTEALKATKDSIDAMKKVGGEMTKSYAYKATVMSYNSQVFGKIFNLLTFGLFPLIFGIRRICEKKE